MEYCPKCDCDERVHETEFLNPKWEDGKRPSRNIFWDFKERTCFEDYISARLYDEIFGL